MKLSELKLKHTALTLNLDHDGIKVVNKYVYGENDEDNK